MRIGERMRECAEANVEREREVQVAAIRSALAEQGRSHCLGCGDPIEAERRAAVPSAKRCTGCQTDFEARGR